jgi:diguanylate cyclase (GGDEF)-like protein/PAS domain S-box-containing protein
MDDQYGPDDVLETAGLRVVASGLIQRADAAAYRLFGRDDLTGTPLLEHIHPSDRRLVTRLLTGPTEQGARIVRLADRGDGSRVAELRVTRPASENTAGVTRIELRGLSTFVAPPRTVHTIARLEKLFLASTDVITVLMPDGDWHASPAGTRILGHPAGYEPEGGLLSLVHPDDIELAFAGLAEVAAGTRAPNEPVRVRVRHADGEYLWFDCTATDLSEDPDVGGIVIVARDVTGEQRAEAERDDVEARYRATFEHSPLGIAIIALDGAVVEANHALCRMVGRSSDAIVGAAITALVHPADRALLNQRTDPQLPGLEAPHAETMRLVHADGQTVWAHADTSLIRDADGEPTHWVALLADITDRKRLEARLEHQAFHDPLTGLPNRARLAEVLEHAWAMRRADAHLAVLFVDLDHFKRINDERDHDAGDELLTIVARRLRAVVRGGDGVCRYGGDEFVVVCPDVEDPEQATVLAQRIQQSLSQPYLLTSGPAVIGASVGVAIAADHASTAELLRTADRAANRAKCSGRNQVVVSDAR